jgi:hypothetical protein
MSAEANLELAEYFERRARLERRDPQERERLAAVAREYRMRAEAKKKLQAGQDLD